jgi:hypothetical protein
LAFLDIANIPNKTQAFGPVLRPAEIALEPARLTRLIGKQQLAAASKEHMHATAFYRMLRACIGSPLYGLIPAMRVKRER